jgi:predicted tellurium resistance membrane protein TerC
MTAELLSILIAIFFFICILFVIAVIITEIPKFLIGVFASIFLICVCICMLPNKKEPSKLYQEKVEAVEKANKELEKFLIDYPEFNEE